MILTHDSDYALSLLVWMDLRKPWDDRELQLAIYDSAHLLTAAVCDGGLTLDHAVNIRAWWEPTHVSGSISYTVGAIKRMEPFVGNITRTESSRDLEGVHVHALEVLGVPPESEADQLFKQLVIDFDRARKKYLKAGSHTQRLRIKLLEGNSVSPYIPTPGE